MLGKDFSALFKAFVVVYFLINSGPLWAADSRHKKIACPTVASSTKGPALTKQVRAFLKLYEPDLRAELDTYRVLYPENVLHQDSLACRFCRLSSTYILTDLTVRFPQVEWQMRQTNGLYQGYFHVYIYSPDLDLMIDSTYRQFIVENPPQNFSDLPAIFIGTPDQFKKLMTGLIPSYELEGYINRTWVQKGPYSLGHRRTNFPSLQGN